MVQLGYFVLVLEFFVFLLGVVPRLFVVIPLLLDLFRVVVELDDFLVKAVTLVLFFHQLSVDDFVIFLQFLEVEVKLVVAHLQLLLNIFQLRNCLFHVLHFGVGNDNTFSYRLLLFVARVV